MFFYRYRAVNKALKEIKLGEFPELTLAEARKALSRKKQEREQGIDPQAEKKAVREAARAVTAERKMVAYTVAKMVGEYVEEKLSKLKRGDESERLLTREFLPKMGKRSAVDISRKELLEQIIRPVMLRAPRVATQLLSAIRMTYAHATEQARLPEDFVSPTVGIKGAAQVRRKRAFSDKELSVFLRWLPSSPYSRTVRDCLRLVLLTGCRSGEVVSALWRDIDLDRGVWTLLDTKNGEAHDVMLSRQATELISYRKGLDRVFVFPSQKAGKHVAQKALGLAQYTARQGNEDIPPADPIEVAWTVHDLRRTVATGLARLGCPRVVQDRILNHVDSSVAAIYDRHHYDTEAREWLQRWADHLDALTVSNVVPIDSGKAA